MSTRVTYENVIKFQYSNRLWKGSDGKFYLADESADGIERFGRPDETEDGPMFICTGTAIYCGYEAGRGTVFSVTCEEEDGNRCAISITGHAAIYLSAHLGMAISCQSGTYKVATSEDRGVLSA